MERVFPHSGKINITCDPRFDLQGDIDKNFVDLVIIAGIAFSIFSGTLLLQAMPLSTCFHQNPSDYLSHRYWKVMKLTTIPSSAERLFQQAMNTVREAPYFALRNIINYFKHSPLQHPNLCRAMTEREHDAFSGFLMNSFEDNKPEDPYSNELIPSENLWAPTIVAVNRSVHDVKLLLRFILSQNFKSDGEIPHPTESRSMNCEEKEAFLEDLSTLFCVNKEMVRNCWKKDRKLLLQWTEEVCKNHYSNWDEITPLQKAWLMRPAFLQMARFLPAKRLNLLPTYKYLEKEVGVKITVFL